MDAFNGIFQVITLLFVFVCLLFLVYVTTRYVGSKAGKAMKGNYISIVESVALGVDKKIHLVKAGDQYVLLASSNKSIEFLTEIHLNDVNPGDIRSTKHEVNLDAKVIFSKYLQAFLKGRGEEEKKVDLHTVSQGESNPVSEKAENMNDHRMKENLSKIKAINNRLKILEGEHEVDKTDEK